MRLSSGLKLFQNVTFNRYIWNLAIISVLAFLVLIASINNLSISNSSRSYVREFITPVLGFIQNMTRKADQALGKGKDLILTNKQLSDLRTENTELKRWKYVALSLMSENKALRKQVKATPEDTPHPFLTARVLTYPSFNSTQRIIIQAGNKDGVSNGQPVVTTEGLIGRVVDSGWNSSEVLLITDSHSKIPVVIEPSHEQAILSGDQSKYLLLDHLEKEISILPGMHVFTSGKGGVFPPGLFIGVTQFDNSKIVVLPSLDWIDLEYVQLLMQQDVDGGE